MESIWNWFTWRCNAPVQDRPLVPELLRLLDPAERAQISQPGEIWIDLFLTFRRSVRYTLVAALVALLLFMARAMIMEWTTK